MIQVKLEKKTMTANIGKYACTVFIF